MTKHMFDSDEKKLYFRVKWEGRDDPPVMIRDKKNTFHQMLLQMT